MHRRPFLASLFAFAGLGSVKAATIALAPRCSVDRGCPAVLNWRNAPGIAHHYDIVDLITGQPHPNMQVFYADANAGILRWCRTDENGAYYMAADKGRGERVERLSAFHQWRHENGRVIPVPSWHIPQPDGTSVLVHDDDVAIAYGESREAFRIIRKGA